LEQPVLRPEGEHFWQLGRAGRRQPPSGQRAVNAFVAAQWLSPGSAARLVHEASRMCRLNEELTRSEVAKERAALRATHEREPTDEECNHLMLARRSRGGTIFNYRPGDVTFGFKGVTRKKVAAAIELARFPFPPDSCNLRQQYELSKDGNNGFTCSAADFPFLAIARKYEELCFLRAMTAPSSESRRPPTPSTPSTYILVGSKILKSGRESYSGAGPEGGAGDEGDGDSPFRLEKVQCNAMGEFAMGARGAVTAVAKHVQFDASSGHYVTEIRRYQTHQQLYHTDASMDQAAYTRETGNPFWSCVGSLSNDMTLNVNGFNSRLIAGLCAVQTGTNAHAGSFGFQEPRTHTYLDMNFTDAEQLTTLGTKHNSNTTLVGFWFDARGVPRFDTYPFDTNPNADE
jgi:hypothetical protein